MDLEIFCSVVILAEGLTADSSRALLRHEKIDGKSKVSKIEKQEELVGCPSESLKMTSELIC